MFALPTSVPPIVGPAVDRIMGTEGTQVLQKFETMDGVYRYVSVAMPLFFPGDLKEDEYLAIMAHIARENGLWDGTPFTTANLDNYPLRPLAIPAATSSGGHLAQATVAADANTPNASQFGENRLGLISLGALVALLAVGGWLLWRNRAR
jgi:hypothetical protein